MRPMGFRQLDHTADVRLEVWAPTVEDLFCEAARALFSLITDITKVVPREERKVEVRGESTEELLVEWLNELLFYHDAEGLLFSEFAILRLNPGQLDASAQGEPFSPERHEILLPVKAVTYHGLKVQRKSGDFRCEIILDV